MLRAGEGPDEVMLGPGDCLHTAPNEFHRVRSLGPGPARALVIKTGVGG